MHIPGAEKFIAHLFGGVKPHHLLSSEELERTKPIVKEFAKDVWPWTAVAWLVLVLSGAGLMYLRYRLTGVATNPIIDERTRLGSLGVLLFAFFSAVYIGATIYPTLLRRRFGQDANLYDSYMATKDGWLPQRCARFCGFLGLPLVLVGPYLSLRATCIDDRGMLVAHNSNGLISSFHTYPQVNSIELYSQFSAPSGVKTASNLVVRFDNGASYSYKPNSDRGPIHPATVAKYISDHSGKPITIGALRP